MEIFGIYVGWVEGIVAFATTGAGAVLVAKIISAIKLGSSTVRNFASLKVDNAQAFLNNKIDTLQLNADSKLNAVDSKIIQQEQQIEALKQELIDYKNAIRSMLDNA